ncbi:cupin domain-containing protein [Roseomonas mucosa]|uniref:cupin domain-containing protein n=1 Tax=Roseomonas mucosa TaxID=207340 RepID=UPI00384F0468
MAVPPRRVVTGHDPHGKAIVSMDGPPAVIVTNALQPGLAFFELWNTASVPVQVDSGDDPTASRKPDTDPPDGGVVIRMVDLPPEGSNGPALDPEQAARLFASVGLKAAGGMHKTSRHPLMHRTESVDFGIVLWGEVHLILDDQEVHLHAGDVVVQRGTIHAWSNRTDKPCRMAFILVDGRYDERLAALLPEKH